MRPGGVRVRSFTRENLGWKNEDFDHIISAAIRSLRSKRACPASEARSGDALGQEGWATPAKVGQVFLRTTDTTGGSHSNQPLEPIPMGHFRLASMILAVQITGAVWLSLGRYAA